VLFGCRKNLETLKDLAKRGDLPHGLIFYGPEMTGKFTAAKALAAYLETGDWDFSGPINEAKIIIPNQEGSIGIDESRAIKEFVYQKPALSKYRMVIVDEAERLTDAAQDALLKIAEEPPESSLLILIVREPELLSATLRSRFQKIFFGEGDVAELEKYLRSEKGFKAEEAKEFAELSGGKAGLALRLKTDEVFRAKIALAEKYLSSAPATRTEMIKKLSGEEFWDIERFLDDLALALLAKYRKSDGFASAYHALMETRRNFGYYNLSPRIQLEALSQKIGPIT
jgi:DNA polymerase-3 subunit delta'